MKSHLRKAIHLTEYLQGGYHKLKVQLYDMLDEYSFDVIF